VSASSPGFPSTRSRGSGSGWPSFPERSSDSPPVARTCGGRRRDRLSAWPGEERRRPSRGLPSYWIRAPLARWLEAEGRTATGLRILDVGCGVKPYLPFFERASDYVGVDVVANEYADVIAPVEALPLDDASFDLVLCVQVLEHADDPAQAVRELHRVTKPGGRVLASTHGTQVYHPSPQDHWRWTHTGLERLFLTNAEWRSVTVSPGAGTGACLAMLTATYIDLMAQRVHAVWAGELANRAVNRLGGALDARSRLLRDTVPGSLIANFHVTAAR
jgi:SAM-dependent methyltransferase